MDQTRVIDAMQQKTVANGCTPGEAAAAAAWVATHRRAHLKVVVGEPVLQQPPQRPSETEYRAWSGQFGLTPWAHAQKKPLMTRIRNWL